jgi:hypothetical protein
MIASMREEKIFLPSAKTLRVKFRSPFYPRVTSDECESAHTCCEIIFSSRRWRE